MGLLTKSRLPQEDTVRNQKLLCSSHIHHVIFVFSGILRTSLMNHQLPHGLQAQLAIVLIWNHKAQGLNLDKPEIFHNFSQLHKLCLQLR